MEARYVDNVSVREILDVEYELRIMCRKAAMRGLAWDRLEIHSRKECVRFALWAQDVDARSRV